jgi:uncharacterized protein
VRGKPWRPIAGGLEVRLRVTPKSQADRLAGLHTQSDGSVSLAVKVRALPGKGAANRAVIETLARDLGISKSRITLVSGSAARLKTVQIEGSWPEIEEAIIGRLRSNEGEKA